MTLCYRLLLTLALLSTTLNAYTLSSDNALPMNVTSDTLEFNNRTGVTIFTGNVKMDQGSTHLRADKVMVYKKPDGEVEKIIAQGNKQRSKQQKRAHYSTLPEEGKDIMEAFGNTIQFYPEKAQAVILGNGTVRQGDNVLNAQHIVYDINKDMLTTIPTTRGEKTMLILSPSS